MKKTPDKIFIAGCGYIGKRVAKLWEERGAEIACLNRSSEKMTGYSSEKFSMFVRNLDNALELPFDALSGSVCYYFIPPPGGGVTDARSRNFCSLLGRDARPEKIIYASATSVYAENSGGVVNEESDAFPSSAMGKRRLDAEKVFLEYGELYDVPVVILRIAGIYGPGRLPVMQIVELHPLLDEAESGPGNRIHADDLAKVCVASVLEGEGGDIFNVCDGSHESMTAYFNLVADLAGLPRPPHVPMAEARQKMTPLMFSYSSDTKVVDNGKMLRKLGVRLRYPDIREGVLASLHESGA